MNNTDDNVNPINDLDPMLKIAQSISEKMIDVESKVSNMIKSNLKDIILCALGIEHRNGQKNPFSVYKTNGYRSELSELITEIAKREITQNVKSYWDSIMSKTTFKKNIIDTIEKEFEECYKRAFYNELRELSESSIKEIKTDVEDECATIIKTLNKTLTPIISMARQRVLDSYNEK